MGGKHDPLQRRKDIAAIRGKMTKQLGAYAVFDEPDPIQENLLTEATESGNYAHYRRANNERALEAIKKNLAGYMYNDNVVVRGFNIKDGRERVVELSHFDVMMKASRLFLDAMNIQNKMWGIYAGPERPRDETPPQAPSSRTIAAEMVHELQRIAKKGTLALKDSEARATDNGAPDPKL